MQSKHYVGHWNNKTQQFQSEPITKKTFTVNRVFIGLTILFISMLIIFGLCIASCQPATAKSSKGFVYQPSTDDKTEAAAYQLSHNLLYIQHLTMEENTAVQIEYFKDGNFREVGIDTELYPNWLKADIIEGISTRGTDTWFEAAKKQPSEMHDYQLEVSLTTYSLYDGKRLVGTVPASDLNQLNNLIAQDNP